MIHFNEVLWTTNYPILQLRLFDHYTYFSYRNTMNFSRLILSALFSFAKVLRRGNAKYRYACGLTNALVDLTTTFLNFWQAQIGYFINSSAIYLSYPSVSSVS